LDVRAVLASYSISAAPQDIRSRRDTANVISCCDKIARMPELVARITVFIGSPGDVGPERLVVQQVVQDLNDAFAGFGNFAIESRTWERHAWPGFGTDAQDVINREVGEYDIFVGLFWNRLGTPTARAPSGTAEEFTQAYKLWEAIGLLR